MTSPSKRRELDITKLLLSDHAVELVDDNISEFYITFHGPKESESCGRWGGSVFLGGKGTRMSAPHAAHGALPTPALPSHGVGACTTLHWAGWGRAWSGVRSRGAVFLGFALGCV